VLITSEQLEKAHKYVANRIENAMIGNKYALNGGCVLIVNTRGKTILTRDEAFIGDEVFAVAGVFVKSDGYNSHQSVVILRPTWPAEFSNLHLSLDQATLRLKGFGKDMLMVTKSDDSNMVKAQLIIKTAKESGVADASGVTMQDERYGSW
jgi:hypothetical protein